MQSSSSPHHHDQQQQELQTWQEELATLQRVRQRLATLSLLVEDRDCRPEHQVPARQAQAAHVWTELLPRLCRRFDSLLRNFFLLVAVEDEPNQSSSMDGVTADPILFLQEQQIAQEGDDRERTLPLQQMNHSLLERPSSSLSTLAEERDQSFRRERIRLEQEIRNQFVGIMLYIQEQILWWRPPPLSSSEGLTRPSLAARRPQEEVEEVDEQVAVWPWIPWLESTAPLLESEDSSPVTVTCLLRIWQATWTTVCRLTLTGSRASLPPSAPHVDLSTTHLATTSVVALTRLLDRYHGGIALSSNLPVVARGEGDEIATTAMSSPAWNLVYIRAGWLWLDLLAMMYSLPIPTITIMMPTTASPAEAATTTDTSFTLNGDYMYALPWIQLESCTTKASEVAIRAVSDSTSTRGVAGMGALEVLLDLLLMSSPLRAHRASVRMERFQHGAQQHQPNGMSPQGCDRWWHRRDNVANTWSDKEEDSYFHQLQYLALRYAIWPVNQGLFHSTPDRAMLLSVLFSSEHSMHGKLAMAYVNQRMGSAQVMLKVRSRQPPTSPAACSLALACSLLVLVMGDFQAQRILSRHTDRRTLWESVLGPRPSQPAAQRSPLPMAIAARAVHFIKVYWRPSLEELGSDPAGLALYLDLALAIQESDVYGAYWGIALLEGPYLQIRLSPHHQFVSKAPWVQDFFRQCLSAAKYILLSVPEATEEPQPPQGERDEDDEPPLGVPIPHHQRRDLNGLLTRHRVWQKRERLSLKSAIEARRLSYEMIIDLADADEIELLEPDPDTISFDLPVLLFKCAASEDDYSQLQLKKCLESLLTMYCKLERKNFTSNSRTSKASRMLPSLIGSACSESPLARYHAAQWIKELFWEKDPSIVLHICNFLAEDHDPAVAKFSRGVLEALQPKGTENQKPKCPYVFLDLTKDDDRAVLSQVLKAEVGAISDLLGTNLSTASLLFNDMGYSRDRLCAPQPLLEECFDSIGLFVGGQVVQANAKWTPPRQCKICYDEEVLCFELQPCGHSFCQTCWVAYLDHQANAPGYTLLATTCPQRGCNRRIQPNDISVIKADLLPLWDNKFFECFVERSHLVRQCPGPDCSVLIFAFSPSSTPCTCVKCDTTFCFLCAKSPHDPATCESFDKWNRIFLSSTFWIQKNSKPCPSCKVPIEKNDGCNHMTCSLCHAEFCWICLKFLRGHFEVHTCNRYDPTMAVTDNDERQALFYTERYKAHDDAMVHMERKLKALQEDGPLLLEQFWFVTPQEIELFVQASNSAVACRQFLKNSYIQLWSIGNDDPHREAMECWQGALEFVTEQLSRLLQTHRLDTIYSQAGDRTIRRHFSVISFLQASSIYFRDRIRYGPN